MFGEIIFPLFPKIFRWRLLFHLLGFLPVWVFVSSEIAVVKTCLSAVGGKKPGENHAGMV